MNDPGTARLDITQYLETVNGWGWGWGYCNHPDDDTLPSCSAKTSIASRTSGNQKTGEDIQDAMY